ncbi:antibiotic biosynthesis monooxygenase [Nonomuraea sp. NPDC050310]|uniref:antibiotic biosynthesis monooxygenase n=1 Tax=unclassified Nonomuraea TaxID=2593643 RepID=UPI0033FDDECB
MKVGMIAHHYPHPDHRDAFVARVQDVAAFFRARPGCLSAECWLTDDAVVSIVRWESDAAFAASFASVGEATGLDVAYDDREVRPREIIRLVEP